MTEPASARRLRFQDPRLPHDVFLQAPNEVLMPDFAEFRSTLNSHFYPARVEALGRPRPLRDPRISALHLSLTTIGYVKPGVAASIDPGDLSTYHVNVVLNGSVISRCGEQETTATPGVAAVFSPDKSTSLPVWGADAAQLSIKFARTRVEEELAALLGHPVVKPIDFRLAFPVEEGTGRRWLAVLSALLQSVDVEMDPLRMQHIELLERSLISGLLLSQLHSYSDQLHATPRLVSPRGAVDLVVEAVDRAPDRGYTLADLSRIAGVSVRSLQYSFQERFRLSPTQYVRQVRLDRVHDDLLQGAGTVADIANYWGFTNPSRFARAYRDRFGEFPAATAAGRRR